MPVPDAITKAELIPNMQMGWADLWAYLDTLSEAQLTQPTDAGGWTIKDHIIHLAAWEGSMNDLLQKKPRWEYMHVSLPVWENGSIDDINAEIYAYNKDLSWEQVNQIFQQAHDELIARVQALSEEDLQHPYNYFQPTSQATDTAAHRLGIASYDHYAKHIPWIQVIAAKAKRITTQAEALNAMRTGFDEFNAYLDTLTEQQLTQPTDAAGWTAKDHVIHLAIWEDGVNALFAGQNQMRSMGVDNPEAWAKGDWDTLNTVIWQQNKNLSLAKVRQRFRDVHTRLLATVESLTDSDLQRPYNSYQPESTYTGPVINTLIGNTSHHYAEHRPWIEAIVKSAKS